MDPGTRVSFSHGCSTRTCASRKHSWRPCTLVSVCRAASTLSVCGSACRVVQPGRPCVLVHPPSLLHLHGSSSLGARLSGHSCVPSRVSSLYGRAVSIERARTTTSARPKCIPLPKANAPLVSHPPILRPVTEEGHSASHRPSSLHCGSAWSGVEVPGRPRDDTRRSPPCVLIRPTHPAEFRMRGQITTTARQACPFSPTTRWRNAPPFHIIRGECACVATACKTPVLTHRTRAGSTTKSRGHKTVSPTAAPSSVGWVRGALRWTAGMKGYTVVAKDVHYALGESDPRYILFLVYIHHSLSRAFAFPVCWERCILPLYERRHDEFLLPLVDRPPKGGRSSVRLNTLACGRLGI